MAAIAQLVERILGKDEVVGSIPTSGSKAGVCKLASEQVSTLYCAGSNPVSRSTSTTRV